MIFFVFLLSAPDFPEEHIILHVVPCKGGEQGKKIKFFIFLLFMWKNPSKTSSPIFFQETRRLKPASHPSSPTLGMIRNTLEHFA